MIDASGQICGLTNTPFAVCRTDTSSLLGLLLLSLSGGRRTR